MKKYFVVLALLLSANYLSAVNVTAYLTFAAFNTPNKGPYIETYLSIIGNTIRFTPNPNGKYQGAVDIAIAFKQNGEIKQAQKYTVNSPEIPDTTTGFPNFIDQQRYSLPAGSYDLEITIADKNVPLKPFTVTQPVKIDFPQDLVSVSNIQLLESYSKSLAPNQLTKSGYDLVPYVSTYYPENSHKIKLYAEVYNAKRIIGEAQKLVINYFLESHESKSKLNDYTAFSKQTANDVNILLSELNIEKLPSGNYNLVVEIRDKDNKIHASQTCFIQRQNNLGSLSFEDLKSLNVSNTFVTRYKNVDTLAEYIRSLRPISSSSEIQFAENLLKSKKLELMQQYLYNFWNLRNAVNPELSWLNYAVEVIKVNKEFGTFNLKGYDTDRGRVYLQYGPPNQRNKVDTEPSAYPYEIWQYDVLEDRSLQLTYPGRHQSNKRFIFYNPDLVSNNYTVLHSDARGEVSNPRWELQLHRRNTPASDIDQTGAPDHMGGNADENFRNPR